MCPAGGKLLVVGCGGSAAGAEHIAGELTKGFKMARRPKTEFADVCVKAPAMYMVQELHLPVIIHGI